jgi:hypothetical protein
LVEAVQNPKLVTRETRLTPFWSAYSSPVAMGKGAARVATIHRVRRPQYGFDLERRANESVGRRGLESKTCATKNSARDSRTCANQRLKLEPLFILRVEFSQDD